MNFNARLVYDTTYDNTPYSIEQSLERALLHNPDQMTGVVTHLAGREDKKFPLTFLTQGQGRTEAIEVNSVEYHWPVFNRMQRSDIIVSHGYNGSSNIGINHSDIIIVMRTDRLIKDHYITTANGTKLRLKERPKRTSGGFLCVFQLMEGTSTKTLALSEIVPGMRLAMSGGAPAAMSLSRGNYSNRQFPGKMKNQISLLRKSYEIAGNFANKRVNIELEVPGQGKTNLYMSFEKWMHMMNWMQDCEEHLWYSKYNRLADGTIPQIDEATGQPIPVGAGVLDQIPNVDTYGKLTLKKLRNTITDVFYGATDTGVKDVVLFTGMGGAREFDEAIKQDGSGFTLVAQSGGVGSKFVTGQDGSYELSYGAYFSTYRHIDGHTVTVKTMNLFDQGGQSEASMRHPETGFPLESYRMVFLDMSNYDGEPNVRLVHEKGRSMRTGVVKGMADTPYDFQGNEVIQLATDEDKSSVQFLKTTGVAIRRPNHCFMLECDYGL